MVWRWSSVYISPSSAFFVTVRAGTAYRKIWRMVNNFFARIIRFTVQKFQLFWVIFCIIIFFIGLWHILILWLAKMPNGDMPVFTLIATGWRYRKIFFYKKALSPRLYSPVHFADYDVASITVTYRDHRIIRHLNTGDHNDRCCRVAIACRYRAACRTKTLQCVQG